MGAAYAIPLRGRIASSAAALLALALAGCAAAAPPPPKTPPPPAPAPPVPKAPTVAAGVDPIELPCQPGAAEACNGLDDDCDGVIDNGCGYSSGGVQVTIGWDTGADIDLYVTDPSGETIYYNAKHRHSPLGGELDHDARGDCRPEQDHPRVENAYWPSPAPKGEYAVDLQYFGPCGDTKQTHVVMSVAVGGRVLGSFRYALRPEERVRALHFQVP